MSERQYWTERYKYKVDLNLPGRILRISQHVHVLTLPGHRMYLQTLPSPLKKLLIQPSHGLHRAYNVHRTLDLYIFTNYIALAKHLQRVYLNWSATRNQSILNKEQTHYWQSRGAYKCRAAYTCRVGCFFPFFCLCRFFPVCIFHAVFRRDRKLLTFLLNYCRGKCLSNSSAATDEGWGGETTTIPVSIPWSGRMLWGGATAGAAPACS